MKYERTVAPDTLGRMVAAIDPDWTVVSATPADRGHHVVYRLTVAGGDDRRAKRDRRECVLKATPPEKPATCGDEARVLTILDDHTPLPVPEVLGVVDDHEALPTPFLVTSALSGANHDRTDLPDFSLPAVRELARSIGRHLATLHDLDAVEAFGTVTVDRRECLDGGRPAADPGTLTVRDPTDAWTDFLRADVDRVIEELEATRFGDLAPAIRAALTGRIDDLTDDHDPVVARIDQSLDNAIVDPDTGAATGLLDWEFCLATTPAYDLAFVEHGLAGGLWKLLPDVPDRQATMGRALLEGYRERGSREVVDTFRENRECYALLTGLHAMVNFEDWFDQVGDVPSNRQEAAADCLRAFVDGLR